MDMTHQVSIINGENLFRLDLIPYVAFVIDSSCVVSCSGVVMHSSRHQSQLNIATSQFTTDLPEVTLNKRSKPPAVDFLGNEISIESFIPKVVMITCN